MAPRLVRTLKVGCPILLLLLATNLAAAADTADAALNPVTGAIELTDAVPDGGDYQVQYVIKPGEGQTPEVALLTDDAIDNLGPQIKITDGGDTWVVWWRDSETPEVVYRVKDQSTGTWSDEVRLSAENEPSRNPTIARESDTTWIAYEVEGQSGSEIAVAAIVDDPQPIPTINIVATTTYSGDRDVLAQSASGHVWVSWIHSSTQVGWVEYDHGTAEWGTLQLESYSGSTVNAARESIRSAILAP